jgi:hypothetical protein
VVAVKFASTQAAISLLALLPPIWLPPIPPPKPPPAMK